MSVVLEDTLSALVRDASDLPERRPDSHNWGVAVLMTEYLVDEEQQVLVGLPTTTNQRMGMSEASKTRTVGNGSSGMLTGSSRRARPPADRAPHRSQQASRLFVGSGQADPTRESIRWPTSRCLLNGRS